MNPPLSPNERLGRWIAGACGAPIGIGSATISSRDFLIAGRDGVAIIPAAIVDDVAARTEGVVATESGMRLALIRGMNSVAAYNRHGKF